MAGGRRPANFATTGNRHSVPADGAGVSALDGYSIWQPHIQTSPTAPYRSSAIPTAVPYFHLPTGAGALPTEPVSGGGADSVPPNVANALATALDTAVVAAVTRALSSGAVNHDIPRGRVNGNGNGCGSQDDHNSSLSFNNVVGGSSRTSSVSAGIDVAGVVELQVESEAQERRRDVEALQNAIAQLDARLDESSKGAAKKEQHRISALEARVEAAELAAKKSAAAAESLQGVLKCVQRTLDDVRVQKRKADSDAGRMRARVAALETQCESMERTFECITSQLSDLEKNVAAGLDVGSQSAATSSPAVEEAVRAAKDAERRAKESLDSVSSMRSRMKKLESSSDTSAKRAEKMSTELALQSGAIEQLRSSGNESIATQVQGLKRLVEANLRSHASSEGVVQSQAQLITRHVCVALRQFIARRITENNMLIDKTLRARVPAYAEGSDEFVLVRETDLSDLAAGDVSSLAAAAAAGTTDSGRETSVVLPRDVVEGFTVDTSLSSTTGPP
jgi:hypothetical protein